MKTIETISSCQRAENRGMQIDERAVSEQKRHDLSHSVQAEFFNARWVR